MKTGIAGYCAYCGLRKKPIGRSAPMAMANYLCDFGCQGYHQDPLPGSLWPGETEEEFGFPVGTDGVVDLPE